MAEDDKNESQNENVVIDNNKEGSGVTEKSKKSGDIFDDLEAFELEEVTSKTKEDNELFDDLEPFALDDKEIASEAKKEAKKTTKARVDSSQPKTELFTDMEPFDIDDEEEDYNVVFGVKPPPDESENNISEKLPEKLSKKSVKKSMKAAGKAELFDDMDPLDLDKDEEDDYNVIFAVKQDATPETLDTKNSLNDNPTEKLEDKIEPQISEADKRKQKLTEIMKSRKKHKVENDDGDLFSDLDPFEIDESD